MIDGSFALFHIPPTAFHEVDHDELDSPSRRAASGGGGKREKWVVKSLERDVGNLAFVVPPRRGGGSAGGGGKPYFVTCATFGKNGEVIWAVTK